MAGWAKLSQTQKPSAFYTQAGKTNNWHTLTDSREAGSGVTQPRTNPSALMNVLSNTSTSS